MRIRSLFVFEQLDPTDRLAVLGLRLSAAIHLNCRYENAFVVRDDRSVGQIDVIVVGPEFFQGVLQIEAVGVCSTPKTRLPTTTGVRVGLQIGVRSQRLGSISPPFLN
jgi:hypothetical protein